jgi:hypothetical protein
MVSGPNPSPVPVGPGKNKRKNEPIPLQAWDCRPWPASGDQDPNLIFAGVGVALTHWAHYETALCRLFSAFIALDRDSEAARRAFGAVRTFEARLDMLRAAADAYFKYFPSPELQTIWIEIARLGRLFAERRNEIAHGAVAQFIPRALTTAGAPDSTALMPADTDVKKRDIHGMPKYAYTAAALHHYALEFERLRQAPIELAGGIVTRAQHR